MLHVKSIRFNPIQNGKRDIEVPVDVELYFDIIDKKPDTRKVRCFKYTYDPEHPESKTYECDFYLDVHDSSKIKGKLWALDRNLPDYYFTLSPLIMPKTENPSIEINIRIQGPDFCWKLSLDN